MPELPPRGTATAVILAQSASEHLPEAPPERGGSCGFAAGPKLPVFTGPALTMIGSNSFGVFITSHECTFPILTDMETG